jgi:hypothetical protein
MTDRRPLPHDDASEGSILGVCLLDNSKIPDVISIVDPDDFYRDDSRIIWEGIISLACENKEVTIASLYEHLGEKFGAAKISALTEGVPRSLDAKYYARVIREKAQQRRVIQAAHKLSEAAYSGDADGMTELIADLGGHKITGKRDHVLADEIRKIVSVTSGDFSVTEIWKSLDYVTKRDKANIRQALHRLKTEGVIERSGKRDGVFRRVESDLEVMDFVNAPTTGLDFDWPLNLHEIATVFPKDICCIAGFKDSGKTGFAVDFIRRNMAKWDIHYFNCEMSNSRLRDRLSKVDDVAITDWKFHPYSRGDNFADVIKPDAVNIVDYLELVEEHWLVAKRMKEIHLKLGQGIAIVMLQKPRGRDTGVGGDKSLQRPTLYVALENGQAKIVSAKTWKGASSPRGKVMDYKLVGGWKFVPQGDWHSEEEGELADKALGKTKFNRRF